LRSSTREINSIKSNYLQRGKKPLLELCRINFITHNVHQLSRGELLVGACPRCGIDAGVEIGETNLKIGKTREQPVSICACGKCGLVYYERIEKLKEFS